MESGSCSSPRHVVMHANEEASSSTNPTDREVVPTDTAYLYEGFAPEDIPFDSDSNPVPSPPSDDSGSTTTSYLDEVYPIDEVYPLTSLLPPAVVRSIQSATSDAAPTPIRATFDLRPPSGSAEELAAHRLRMSNAKALRYYPPATYPPERRPNPTPPPVLTTESLADVLRDFRRQTNQEREEAGLPRITLPTHSAFWMSVAALVSAPSPVVQKQPQQPRPSQENVSATNRSTPTLDVEMRSPPSITQSVSLPHTSYSSTQVLVSSQPLFQRPTPDASNLAVPDAPDPELPRPSSAGGKPAPSTQSPRGNHLTHAEELRRSDELRRYKQVLLLEEAIRHRESQPSLNRCEREAAHNLMALSRQQPTVPPHEIVQVITRPASSPACSRSSQYLVRDDGLITEHRPETSHQLPLSRESLASTVLQTLSPMSVHDQPPTPTPTSLPPEANPARPGPSRLHPKLRLGRPNLAPLQTPRQAVGAERSSRPTSPMTTHKMEVLRLQQQLATISSRQRRISAYAYDLAQERQLTEQRYLRAWDYHVQEERLEAPHRPTFATPAPTGCSVVDFERARALNRTPSRETVSRMQRSDSPH